MARVMQVKPTDDPRGETQWVGERAEIPSMQCELRRARRGNALRAQDDVLQRGGVPHIHTLVEEITRRPFTCKSRHFIGNSLTIRY